VGLLSHVLKVLPVFVLTPSSGAQDPARRSITGVVIDSARTPLAYANVTVGQTRTIANDSGRFTLRTVGRGPVKLLVRRIGFEIAEVSLPAGADTTISVMMAPVPTRLSAVAITASSSAKLELRGFYERMRDVDRGINRGYFITPEDLEQRRPNFITQMLEGYPSIRVSAMHGQHYAQILGVGGCKMTVYLDGVRIVGKLNPRAEEPVNMMVKPNEIAGTEIYPRGVGAPPQYQSLNGACGIVLIWTK
jgi:hypothetical protein